MKRRLLTVPLAALAIGCGEDKGGDTPPADAGETLEHVHGLGVNPADGALFIATHRGLFRSAKDETSAEPVGESRQDTMGFSVVGPNRFIGSGHPDAQSGGPPLLGLIESKDAGRTWRPVVLQGEADFHTIETDGEGFYAHDGHTGRLFHGSVGGSGLSLLPGPRGSLFDLAADPGRKDIVFAATDRGLYRSRDRGRRWRTLDGDRTGMLAHDGRKLILVDGNGQVHQASADGRDWQQVGTVPGAPVALLATRAELYVAIMDGPVLVSRDQGRSWAVRVAT